MIPVIGIFNALACSVVLAMAWCFGLPITALVGIAFYLVVAWLLARLIWVNATPGYFGFGTVVMIIMTSMAWPLYAPSAFSGLRSGELVWTKRR